MSRLRALVDNFPIVIDQDAIRRAAGGRRRLRATSSLEVTLDDGVVVEVGIVHTEWRWGSLRPWLRCPMCDGKCNALRRIPEFPFVACRDDIMRRYRAKYASQLRRPVAERATSHTSMVGGAPPLGEEAS